MSVRAKGSPRTSDNGNRVHWDEQIIAEHDKERGTRQKIDEPDTPYVRSPQTTSDSEGGPASSEDDHRPCAHKVSKSTSSASVRVRGKGASAAVELCESLGVTLEASAFQSDAAKPGLCSPGSDVCPEALASRLAIWVRSGAAQRRQSSGSAASSDGNEYAADAECSRLSSACSSRSSSSAPQGRKWAGHTSGGHRRSSSTSEKRLVLPEEDSPQPKPASAQFKAKRAQHYNEVAALRAYKPCRAGDESSADSNTSDENARIKTNTNTNINQTIAKAADKRRRPVGGEPESEASSELEVKAPLRGSSSLAPAKKTGAESQDALRSRRRDESGASSEEAPGPRPHTNASSQCIAGTEESSADAVDTANRDARVMFRVDGTEPPPNSPMRPRGPKASPTAVAAPAEHTTSATPNWRAKRQAHYSEMAAALRSGRSLCNDDDEDDEEGKEDEKDEKEGNHSYAE